MITQRELARQVGISSTNLCEILNGKKRPRLNKALKLEEATGVERMVWLYGTPEEIKQKLKSKYGEINKTPGRRGAPDRLDVLESKLDRIIELLTQKQEQPTPGGNHETA